MDTPLRRQCWLLVLVVFLTLIPSVVAQTYRGSINGTVTDQTGAVVANANVIATNAGTGVKSSSVSSSGGDFLFSDLPLGTYSVSVTSPGFAVAKFDNISVSAGIIRTLPVKLSVSTNNLTVEVDAGGLTLDTTTVTQTTVLEAKAVEDMPLNGRDFTQLIQLTPGFAGYVGGGYGSLNGTRANQMNWQIDGVDNNDLWHNIPAVNQGGVSGIAGIILPIDAVDEFSAQTQAGPEGGRNPGGTINLTLKSGSNQLHGTVYYFNRNELFGAKNPFFTTKQKVRNYNDGFSLGGPFWKDKLFGFLTFEHQRFVIGTSANGTLPSLGWQSQAKAVLAANGTAVLPVMQNVLNSLWGSSRLAADTAGVQNNFVSNDPEFGYSWNGLGKVDYHLSDKDNLSVHWFVGQGNQVAPVGSQIIDYYEVAPIHVQNIAIVYNRQINSHMSNELLMGVNYFNQVFNDYNTNFNVQSLGFVTGATFPNAPHIAIGSFVPVGETPPEGRNDITGHITDQLSYTFGKHELRFGGEFRQAQLDEFYKRKSVGSFTFDGTRTTCPASQQAICGSSVATSTYVLSLADFLSGRTSAANITLGDPERQVFDNTWFLNAGDSWKLTPKTTINYGLRYDYVGPLHDGTKDLSVFNPADTTTNGLAIQGVQIGNLYQQYYKSVSPRVGVSQSLDSKTVVRVGYGWYFDTINLNPFLDNRPGNAAPNGVEGNFTGANAVSTISAPNSGKTQIVSGQNIFGTTVAVCNTSIQCGAFSIAPNFRPSYNENYSLNVERTLAPNVIATLGYVGSEARHLLSLLDINQTILTGANAGNRPYSSLYPQYTNINQIQSIGTSNYNSLQAQLRVQRWHGLSMSGMYTLSHNLDEVTAYRGSLPQNNLNFKGDYGNSDFDTRNSVVIFASYDLPRASHFKPALNGWSLNSLMSFHGGQPFTVHASGDISGTGEGNDRADQIGPIRKGFQGQAPNAQWVDPSAFADPTPGTFGTSARNAYYGPGYSDVDFSVFKDTKVGERVDIQFRAEMFNLFNRINYAPPGDGYASVGGDFGLDDTIGDYNGAPGIGAGECFNTQLGMKVIF